MMVMVDDVEGSVSSAPGHRPVGIHQWTFDGRRPTTKKKFLKSYFPIRTYEDHYKVTCWMEIRRNTLDWFQAE